MEFVSHWRKIEYGNKNSIHREMINYSTIKQRLINSKLFKDSFWAVFGNGIGNALLLFAGILIARLLGKDVYGEYGMVKTTMFYISSFATFGLGVTSTKYVVQLIQEKSVYVKNVVKDAIVITISFSSLIAVLLFICAPWVAQYLEEPNLVFALRALAVVIIFRSITTTLIGVLAGFKLFKTNAVNSVASGLFMLVLSIPFTYLWGLEGSLLTLLLSQAFNAILNFISVNKTIKKLSSERKSFKKELIKFSFPVALQESSFTICNWAAIMLLTKYASMGEVGLYTASAQWNSIITMIPGLLINVVLSYLSSSVKDKQAHTKTIKQMLLINFTTTLVPFILVYILADIIASFYGASFNQMGVVLRVLTFSTILEACASVYKSELLALGKTWLLFSIRFMRDIILVSSVYVLLIRSNGENGAVMYSWAVVFVSLFFLGSLYLSYLFITKSSLKNEY